MNRNRDNQRDMYDPNIKTDLKSIGIVVIVMAVIFLLMIGIYFI